MDKRYRDNFITVGESEDLLKSMLDEIPTEDVEAREIIEKEIIKLRNLGIGEVEFPKESK